MNEQRKVKLVQFNELEKLLGLYKHLNKDEPEVNIDESLKKLWKDIYEDPNTFYLVANIGGEIVSSCMLTIIKNLTRSARPFGIIENVVTHLNYRKKGFI